MPSSIGLWIAMIKPAYSDGYADDAYFASAAAAAAVESRATGKLISIS
jgi:hypothetical protein